MWLVETFEVAVAEDRVRSRKSGLRTVDVARRAGCSVQQVRNLERDNLLPPAERTSAGYRRYTDGHVLAAVAYRTLAAGIGPIEAKTMMRAAHRPPTSDLLALVDAAHTRLHIERRDIGLARQAVAAISAERIDDPQPADAMTISELANALGVRTSTLRHWDDEGLVVPPRSPRGRARSYSPVDVRDARIVHQLRQAGYRIEPLQELMPQLRQAHRRDEINAALLARHENITARSRALLRGAATLEAVLDAKGQ